jgi:hypothetical protein
MLLSVVTEVSKDLTALLSIPRRVNQTGLLDPELKSEIFRLNDGDGVPLDMPYVKILESS